MKNVDSFASSIWLGLRAALSKKLIIDVALSSEFGGPDRMRRSGRDEGRGELLTLAALAVAPGALAQPRDLTSHFSILQMILIFVKGGAGRGGRLFWRRFQTSVGFGDEGYE